MHYVGIDLAWGILIPVASALLLSVLAVLLYIPLGYWTDRALYNWRQKRLKAQFARREPERVYLAVVYGRPDPPSGTWRDMLVWDEKALIQKETHPRDPRGTEAISDYRVVEPFRDASLIEVRLRTGRRNQIRIQARLRGHRHLPAAYCGPVAAPG